MKIYSYIQNLTDFTYNYRAKLRPRRTVSASTAISFTQLFAFYKLYLRVRYNNHLGDALSGSILRELQHPGKPETACHLTPVVAVNNSNSVGHAHILLHNAASRKH